MLRGGAVAMPNRVVNVAEEADKFVFYFGFEGV